MASRNGNKIEANGLQASGFGPTMTSVVLDALPAMVLVTDREGKIVSVSDQLSEACGRKTEDLAGKPVGLILTDPDDIQPGANPVMATLTAGSGKSLPVRISSSYLTADEEQCISVLVDISDILTAQQDLADKASEADEASKAKSRFLAAMSHEIRTPMNAILGFAQLLKLSNLDYKRQSHVDAIISAGGTLMNLLTDLLDLSHVESGRMRIDHRPFELQPLIDQVADWWHSSAREKGLRLNIAVERGLPERVISDPVRLQQVLNNFLSNAMRYTNEGRVTLSVEEITRVGQQIMLRFEVADTGIGMSEDQVAQLFKPFVQIESDFTKERGGWGLGLSICSNISRMMDAKIGVDSQPGVGSSFYFEIPVEIYEEEHADLAPVEDAASGREAVEGPVLKVLVAEDNSLNQDMMQAMLRDLGHSATLVSNGFEAVEALIKDDYDLVLMDITMPGLDGLGATEQIRSFDTDMRDIPIIACSAHVGSDVQDRYRKAGIDDFVPKPIDRDVLRTVLARIQKVGAEDTASSA